MREASAYPGHSTGYDLRGLKLCVSPNSNHQTDGIAWETFNCAVREASGRLAWDWHGEQRGRSYVTLYWGVFSREAECFEGAIFFGRLDKK